jgi:hypothetical protein
MADVPSVTILAPLCEISMTSHLLVAKLLIVIHADLCRILRTSRFSFTGFMSQRQGLGSQS